MQRVNNYVSAVLLSNVAFYSLIKSVLVLFSHAGGLTLVSEKIPALPNDQKNYTWGWKMRVEEKNSLRVCKPLAKSNPGMEVRGQGFCFKGAQE